MDGSSFLRHSLTALGFIEGWKSILKMEEQGVVFAKIEERLNEVAITDEELRLNVPKLLIHVKKN